MLDCIDNKTYGNIVTDSENNTNYIKYSNGLIICWGKQTFSKSVGGGNNTDGETIRFPIAFTSVPSVQATHFNGNQFNMSIIDATAYRFTPRYRNVNTSTSATTSGCFWIAIGF